VVDVELRSPPLDDDGKEEEEEVERSIETGATGGVGGGEGENSGGTHATLPAALTIGVKGTSSIAALVALRNKSIQASCSS